MALKSAIIAEKKKEMALEGLTLVLDSSFLSALAEPSRIEVLKQVIRKGRADISELAEGMSLDRSVISRHLGILYDAGILVREKEGRKVFYRLDPIGAVARFRKILDTIEQTIEICCPPNKTLSL